MMQFTDSHEWVKVEGKTGTVGITKYAQQELGEIVHVELPKLGAYVNAGQEVCVLESTKAAADIYSPVSGTITKVNAALEEDISLLNQAPEAGGWIYQLEIEGKEEETLLLDRAEYEAMLS